MKKIYSSILLCFILSLTCVKSFATFTILTSVTDPTCDGAHNGILTITPVGGVAPFTYSLDGTTFQVSNIFTNLEGGATYGIVVMDANGDTQYETVVTNLGTPLTANVSKTDALCLGGTNASLTLNNVNATAPFTYRITGGYFIDSSFNGASTLSFPGIRADFYNILIEDALGCFGYATANILEGDSLTGTAIVHSASCTGSDDAMFTFSFSAGGTAPFNLGDVTNNLFGASNGTPNDGFGPGHEGITYNFAITDAVGCVGAVSAVVPMVFLQLATQEMMPEFVQLVLLIYQDLVMAPYGLLIINGHLLPA